MTANDRGNDEREDRGPQRSRWRIEALGQPRLTRFSATSCALQLGERGRAVWRVVGGADSVGWAGEQAAEELGRRGQVQLVQNLFLARGQSRGTDFAAVAVVMNQQCVVAELVQQRARGDAPFLRRAASLNAQPLRFEKDQRTVEVRGPHHSIPSRS